MPESAWRSPPPDPERARVLDLLRRHGENATSFQVLEPGLSYWFDPVADAVVAYVTAAGKCIVAGQPVGPEDAIADVCQRFVAANLPALFFAVEPSFLGALAAAGVAFDAVQIGEQPDWDPQAYTVDGPARRSLRSQVNRARNKGVRVRRVGADELARAPGSLRAEIDAVLQRWRENRHMRMMRFMVDLAPFGFPEERRYYVAEHGDMPVGFLAAVPVYARGGWFFEDVIRVPEAPNGTAELLIHIAMLDARQSADRYVTLGMAPLAGVDARPGAHRALRRVMVACRDRLGGLYSFEGVRRFKARFHPDVWTPQYLVAMPGPVGVRGLRAVLLAFAGGGLLRFGFETALHLLSKRTARTWTWALWLLGGALVPWTVLLAMADGVAWFGDVSIQVAWVIFDAGLAAALFLLAHQVRRKARLARPMAMFLAGTTMTDFLLSSVQAVHLHVGEGDWGPLKLVLVAIGICGPLLATLMLLAIASFTPILPRSSHASR